MILKSLYTLIFLFTLSLLAQELPPIQNFTPIEYNAGNQNWGIGQSDNQTLYIANNSGLLEFNGTSWRLYQAPFGTPVKSVVSINDKVYTGSYMEFGYWSRNQLGVLNYLSLSSKLLTPLIEDEDFWNITPYKDWVLFQSLDRIYIYNSNSGSFEIIEAKTTSAKIFEVRGKIFFQIKNKGFFTLENGKPVLVSDDVIFLNTGIVDAFSLGGKILVITDQGEFFYLNESNVEKWNIAADINLSSTKIYSSLLLDDGSFVLGSISKGVYHFNKNGELIRHINQEKGLNNNTVLSIYQDFDHNLWLGLDNGLSVLNLESPFNEYTDHLGTLGVVYTAKKMAGKLYLGTNQGLFLKNDTDDIGFKLVAGTEGQVWMLKEIDGTLFCGHHNGTYIIEDDRATNISKYPGTWDIQPLKSNSALLIQGNYEGLSVLERKYGTWDYRNNIEGFDSSSRFFEFVDEHQVLINHDFKGIFDLTLDSAYTKVLNMNQIESKGIGSSLLKYHDDIVYATINGVFKYLPKERTFNKDSLLTTNFFTANDSIVGILQSTNNGERLWGFTNDNIISQSTGFLSEKPLKTEVSIPKFFRRSMGVLGFESVVHLEDELFLIGISNGYITLDLGKITQREYQISLNEVSIKSYDTPKVSVILQNDDEFKYSQNSLGFDYNVTEYDKYTEVYYQYRLDGLYGDWSNWSTSAEISFDNLPYGNYNFQVRGKVGNELTSNVETYSFIIQRPWYFSYLAMVCYFILGVLLSILIHRVYRGYYKKQQAQLIKENNKRLKRKKLKNQRKIVQIKNNQLQELIDSKNRELAISTMSIIKKNEFLNAIKDKLKSSGGIPEIKAVIKTIDRNINNVDDWKFFENAFNNADKDFLKKIKDKHPELSSNDLRLCAYLRLNLSSKEIAPLLNISVRSVEVKRYRLRKKMNLSREAGLTDYIINL
ncbi:regulatory LuxR family protein [Maribacter spongiicola]|uniref:Regulatory LuxR family protein n=1 Tax=Maribacter spongiicola TaxID=1206753 RepID=A0A4V3ERN4_9FLAO|nr:triple tyrosine motif-containing protein [Maribacter spongiicola]TDT46813.1 regulatory LuxR family protein [Maribacter spongiicola]